MATAHLILDLPIERPDCWRIPVEAPRPIMENGTDWNDGPQAALDWEQARGFLRLRIRRKLGAVDPILLDELVQEACVRMLRTLRREQVENEEAMMTTIAYRTAFDHIRRKKRHSLLFDPLTNEVTDRTAARVPQEEYVGDPQQRVAFVVLEFFRSRSPNCRELALRYFRRKNWREVAAELGLSHEAVRVRWSRCVALLRGEVKKCPALEILRDWAYSG